MLAPILGPVVGGADPPEPALVVDLPRQPARRRGRAGAGAGGCCRRTDSGEAGAGSTRSAWAAARRPAAALVYGLSELGTNGGLRPRRASIWPIVAGVVLTAVFMLARLRASGRCSTCASIVSRVFAAASLATFGLGAALFGAMILVPLYYQEVRHESVIVTGLLLGPQGLGMLRRDAARRASDPAHRRRPVASAASRCGARGDPAGASSARTPHACARASSSSAASASASPSCRRWRGVRGAEARPAPRRGAAAERRDARRRLDRYRRAGGRAAARLLHAPTRRPRSATLSAQRSGGPSASPRLALAALCWCSCASRASDPRAAPEPPRGGRRAPAGPPRGRGRGGGRGRAPPCRPGAPSGGASARAAVPSSPAPSATCLRPCGACAAATPTWP